ncbi:MAG: site-specific integrase, partial [Ignavibacteria bacterium]|nr:site-specific integrase [Ignavibacteria bacterium]
MLSKQNHLEKLLNEYLITLDVVKGLSLNSRNSYRLDLLRLIKFFGSKGIDDYDDVEWKVLLEYFEVLKKIGLSNKSIARNYSSVKGFFKYLHSNESIQINPILKFKPPKIERT